MSSTLTNPFVGLRPFESDESLLFFGRQDQTLELLQRLHDHHFVGVVGSSGSGKSSLIRAGLIPRLKAGYLVQDRDHWMIVILKPGESPVHNLAASLIQELNNENAGLTAGSLVKKIQEEGADAIIEILKYLWTEKRTNIFILVDQFEELFRFSLDTEDAAKKDEAIEFVNILLELSGHTEFPVYVVITMRSDFIGDCSIFYGLPEALNKSQYLVPRLTRMQLKNAIEGPVRLFGSKLNPALTARLLNDVQSVHDELPLLQHVLMRTWGNETNVNVSRELGHHDYDSVGGIEKALSIHADEALKGMNETDLDHTKKIFQALTTIDQNGRKIRRPAHLSELASIAGATKESVLKIIDHFNEDKRSFLVINKSEVSGDPLIDISHESLIRQWETLRQWVDEEAESGKMYLQISEAAALYNQNKKDLIGGTELQLALDWMNERKPDAVWAGRYNDQFDKTISFLHQSKAHSEQEFQQKQAMLKREQEAELQKAKAKKTRIIASGSLLGLIVTLGFAFWVYKLYLKTDKLKDEAKILAAKAVEEKGFAITAAARAEDFAKEAEKQKKIADQNAALAKKEKLIAQKNAAYAKEQEIFAIQKEEEATYLKKLADENAANAITQKKIAEGNATDIQRTKNLGDSKMMALKAIKFLNDGIYEVSNSLALYAFNLNSENNGPKQVTEIYEALNNLYTYKNSANLVYTGHHAGIKTISRRHGTDQFVTGDEKGNIHLLTVKNNKIQGSFFANEKGQSIRASCFSEDGKQIVTADFNGGLTCWDVSGQDKKYRKQMDGIPLAMESVESAKGQFIICITAKNALLFSMQKDSFNMQATSDCYRQITAASISANGDYAALAMANTVQLFNVREYLAANVSEALKNPSKIFSVEETVTALCIDETSGRIAIGTEIGNIYLVSMTVNEPRIPFPEHKTAVSSLRFGTIKDQQYLVSTGYDHTGKIFNVKHFDTEKKEDGNNDESIIFTHDKWIYAACFSSQGQQIITTGDDNKVRLWFTEMSYLESLLK